MKPIKKDNMHHLVLEWHMVISLTPAGSRSKKSTRPQDKIAFLYSCIFYGTSTSHFIHIRIGPPPLVSYVSSSAYLELFYPSYPLPQAVLPLPSSRLFIRRRKWHRKKARLASRTMSRQVGWDNTASITAPRYRLLVCLRRRCTELFKPTIYLSKSAPPSRYCHWNA